jgi:hypothetical protein
MSFNANTSQLGAALAVEGLLIYVGSVGSPETPCVVTNATDMKLGMKSKTVDVTNFGNKYMKILPTLLTLGPLSFTVFYQPEDPSHRNSPGSSTVADGLIYAWINQVLLDWQIKYPSGTPATAAAAGYVTEFSIDGKTGDVFRASVTVEFNDDNPSLP